MTIFEYEQTTKRKSRAAEDFKQLASHLLGAEVTV